MKIAAAVTLALCAGAYGEDAPATMTMLTVKLESPEIPKDSFAAQPKRMYRAGSRHCRIEQNSDVKQGIHELKSMSEPDPCEKVGLTKPAGQIEDEGPPFNANMPI